MPGSCAVTGAIVGETDDLWGHVLRQMVALLPAGERQKDAPLAYCATRRGGCQNFAWRTAGTAIVLIFWLFFRRKLGAAFDAIGEAFAPCGIPTLPMLGQAGGGLAHSRGRSKIVQFFPPSICPSVFGLIYLIGMH